MGCWTMQLSLVVLQFLPQKSGETISLVCFRERLIVLVWRQVCGKWLYFACSSYQVHKEVWKLQRKCPDGQLPHRLYIIMQVNIFFKKKKKKWIVIQYIFLFSPVPKSSRGHDVLPYAQATAALMEKKVSLEMYLRILTGIFSFVRIESQY